MMKADRCRAVAYKRVSTAKQGYSGLGMEGQDVAIDGWLGSHGCKLVGTYTEVESGKLSVRPELDRALAHARRIRGVLVVAKLDRLSRDVKFLLTLLDGMGSEASVVFCDLPEVPVGPVGRFLNTQMASAAELERGLISERTKAALAAYKARGGVLGRDNLSAEDKALGRRLGAKAVRDKAIESCSDILPDMVAWRTGGATQQAIADRLNALGHTTRRGAPWNQVQVKRVLDRA